MPHALPTQDQALCFYRAALTAARHIDRENDPRVLDPDADAAWRAYGSDLPMVVRCDLVLRNFAMLYPAAFAPGPVFRLAGWYDDDPWGTGFERPPAKIVEGLFAARATPPNATTAATAAEALAQAAAAWGVDSGSLDDRDHDPRLPARLSPSVNLVVAGARAMAEVARAILAGERLSARTQVIVVSERPESRHLLGIACALQREAGVPWLVAPRPADEAASDWIAREKPRIGITRAELLVTSGDASANEIDAARALASALGADETIAITSAAGGAP